MEVSEHLLTTLRGGLCLALQTRRSRSCPLSLREVAMEGHFEDGMNHCCKITAWDTFGVDDGVF